MVKEYKNGDIILCSVKDIVKTTVFVETEDGLKGSINFSEVAPGRIRNIRDYVVPNKIIACKILEATPDHLFLSIRRVKGSEKENLMNIYKKSKSIESLLKKTLGEKAEKIIQTIKETEDFGEFFEDSRKDLKKLEKYFNKEEIEKISPMLKEKKEKEIEIKKEFTLSCKEHDGLLRIKKLLGSYEDLVYLGSSKFVIKAKTNDPKHTESKLNQILETIEKQAKKEKCEFSLKK